jgi:GNAT superfamily N-acetyltransferase
MSGTLRLQWCEDSGRSSELALFFAENVTPAYISHSEMWGSRALGPDHWRVGLPEILRMEIEPRLSETHTQSRSLDSQPILVAEDDDGLLGISFVTFKVSAPVPFSIVEDLIVLPSRRSAGVGAAIVDWIAREARERGILRMYLESGIHNEEAHRFFERVGFHPCSVVMMRAL